ncbi:MAG: hypothetical protein A4E24_01842 [Methanomethylovorans sp. PtaU1.Bin093]|nr:MAG: hypothetical protein A4E24_01842 [Methanomethylovorans sp. PtaU1.Bin093]
MMLWIYTLVQYTAFVEFRISLDVSFIPKVINA